jgi:AraC-like DNA-binding protein
LSNEKKKGDGCMSDEILFEPQALILEEPLEFDRLKEVAGYWELRWTRLKPGDVEVGISIFDTPRLQYSCFDYTNGIFIQGSPPKGSMIISICQSQDLISSHNQSVNPYELVILTYGEEIDYIASNANTIFTLAIEEQYFFQSFSHYFGQTLDEVRKEKRLVLEEKYTGMFIAHLQHWLHYFASEKRKFDRDVYYGIEQEILGMLFSLIHTTRKLQTKDKFDISKAREILHENIDNIYMINDLVEDLHISPRTLQHHFQKKLGLTPKQYLQQLRLDAVRKELLAGDPNLSNISDIALKYGFFHASHFGAVYKKVFGETPSQTLQQSL